MLLLAIHHSLMTLMWASFLLFLMLYLTSLVFLGGVTTYLVSGETDAATAVTLQTYFGALDGTMLTLFLCISGGIRWELIVRALMEVHGTVL